MVKIETVVTTGWQDGLRDQPGGIPQLLPPAETDNINVMKQSVVTTKIKNEEGFDEREIFWYH